MQPGVAGEGGRGPTGLGWGPALVACAILALSATAGAGLADEERRPNVLVLFSDDQRFDTIAALGHPVIQTPHLDRLVRDGTSFTHTFVTVPVCTPGRAELLTGQTAFRNGVHYFGEAIHEGSPRLPQTLADAGYFTWFTGKWHNDGTPKDHGFRASRRVFRGGMGPHEMTIQEGDREGEAAGFSSELFADAAIDRLTDPPDRPWFAWVAFTAPHDPRTPPDDFAALYDPETLPLSPNFLPEHPFDNGEMTIRDEQLEAWPRTPEAIRRHLADYYGMISHLDAQIGRILDALDQSGQADHTLVVFLSDNGLAIGSHGLMGKMSLYEHSVRIPLVMRGPGIPRDRRIDALTHIVDLFPTLCDLVDVERPDNLDGRSLVPLLTGEATAVRDHVVCAYTDVQRMVRTRRWKLIEYPQIGKSQLFNLKLDPHELSNLLEPWRWRKTRWYEPPTDPTTVQKIAENLRATLDAWRDMMDDPHPPDDAEGDRP